MTYGKVVLACTKGEFTANGIRWFTDSRFSHSFLTVPPQVGLEMCIEASSKGVAEIEFGSGYRNDPSQTYITYELNVPQDVIDAAIKCCLADLEHGYAFLAYPWFMWRTLNWKLFKRDIKAQDNWYSKEMVCSGLVRYYLDCPPMREYFSKNGIKPLFEGFGLGSVQCEDLYSIFEARTDLFTRSETKGF